MEAMIQSAGWWFLHDGQRPAGLTRTFSRIVLAITETVLAEVTAGCAGAEAILTSSWGAVGYPVAESYGIPCAFLSLDPGVPTDTFPLLEVSPERSLGKLANRASYVLAEQRAWKIIRSRINHWCTHSLGLPPCQCPGLQRSHAGCAFRCCVVLVFTWCHVRQTGAHTSIRPATGSLSSSTHGHRHKL